MHEPASWWHVRLSRRLNRGIGGADEMLCAALWVSGSRWCAVIDAVMLLRGERQHCRKVAAYERWRVMHAPGDEMPNRARLAGW